MKAVATDESKPVQAQMAPIIPWFRRHVEPVKGWMTVLRRLVCLDRMGRGRRGGMAEYSVIWSREEIEVNANVGGACRIVMQCSLQ